MVETLKLVERGGKGFVEGIGLDSLLWAISSYVPQLAEPSPIEVPFWHPVGEGTHWDDLITILSTAGIAVYGVIKKNYNIAVEGAAMLLGGWFISQFQPYPSAPPWSTPQTRGITPRITPFVSKKDNLIQVD